jgi:hypothetical protein
MRCRLVENVGLLVTTARKIKDYNLIPWNWYEPMFETQKEVGILFPAPLLPKPFAVFTGPADDEATPVTRPIRLETPRTQPPAALLPPVIDDRTSARDIVPPVKRTIIRIVTKAGKISSAEVKKQCEGILCIPLGLNYSTAISDLYFEDKILVEDDTLSMPSTS